MGRGKIGRGPPTVLVSIASTSWNVGFFIARTGSIIGVILSSGGKERRDLTMEKRKLWLDLGDRCRDGMTDGGA